MKLKFKFRLPNVQSNHTPLVIIVNVNYTSNYYILLKIGISIKINQKLKCANFELLEFSFSET